MVLPQPPLTIKLRCHRCHRCAVLTPPRSAAAAASTAATDAAASRCRDVSSLYWLALTKINAELWMLAQNGRMREW
jgi:hypothetical protein